METELCSCVGWQPLCVTKVSDYCLISSNRARKWSSVISYPLQQKWFFMVCRAEIIQEYQLIKWARKPSKSKVLQRGQMFHQLQTRRSSWRMCCYSTFIYNNLVFLIHTLLHKMKINLSYFFLILSYVKIKYWIGYWTGENPPYWKHALFNLQGVNTVYLELKGSPNPT